MTSRMWSDVLIVLALTALAAAIGVAGATYTYEQRRAGLDARVTAVETLRIEAVVTDPPTVEPVSISPPLMY